MSGNCRNCMKCRNSGSGRGVCVNHPFGGSYFWVILCQFGSCVSRFSLWTSRTWAGMGQEGRRAEEFQCSFPTLASHLILKKNPIELKQSLSEWFALCRSDLGQPRAALPPRGSSPVVNTPCQDVWDFHPSQWPNNASFFLFFAF